MYLYNSSYNPNVNYPDCQPPNDRIDIVKVPLRHPEQAAVVASPLLFPDGAIFNGDGSKVVFMDELGGGGGAECNTTVGPDKGATAVFDIRHRKLQFRSYYKIPRHQADRENCVSHNGSLIPVTTTTMSTAPRR